MWHSFVSLNISADFAARGSVTKKRGRNSERGPFSGDVRVVVICFTLTTLKPMSSSPFDMSSAEVRMGRCLMTAFMGFSLFGKKV
jgi:hypothetical protein